VHTSLVCIASNGDSKAMVLIFVQLYFEYSNRRTWQWLQRLSPNNILGLRV